MKKLLAVFTVFVMFVLLCVPAGAAAPRNTELYAAVNDLPAELPASAEEWEVLRITNNERMNAGLAPLTMLPALQTATDTRALELIQSFSHTRPDGSDCFTVISEVGLNCSSAGENIAAGYQNPSAVMGGWMNSDGHRANILNSGFKHIGVGYVYRQNTEYTRYWVQLFCTGWGCNYSNFEVLGDPDMSSSVDVLGLVGRFTCGEGYCYLPLTSAMCISDTSANGTRTVTFAVFGLTASVSVGALAGDADGNGVVNANDALLVLRYSLGILNEISSACDVNGDGVVNANDALFILRAALGIVTLKDAAPTPLSNR